MITRTAASEMITPCRISPRVSIRHDISFPFLPMTSSRRRRIGSHEPRKKNESAPNELRSRKQRSLDITPVSKGRFQAVVIDDYSFLYTWIRLLPRSATNISPFSFRQISEG